MSLGAARPSDMKRCEQTASTASAFGFLFQVQVRRTFPFFIGGGFRHVVDLVLFVVALRFRDNHMNWPRGQVSRSHDALQGGHRKVDHTLFVMGACVSLHGAKTGTSEGLAPLRRGHYRLRVQWQLRHRFFRGRQATNPNIPLCRWMGAADEQGRPPTTAVEI